MKRIQFYVCPNCGNIMTATGVADISCCGRKLSPLVAKPCDEEHSLKVEPVEDEYYITSSHPMTKAHYLNFVAQVGIDRITLVRLYPEQNLEVRIPKMSRGKLFFGCNQHGLYEVK